MKIYAVNGSPRKHYNTAQLLQSALDGAKKAGEHVETELIHLGELNIQGCRSCFACKRLGGKSYGRCALNDDLTPVLQKLSNADGIIFGSPIYLGNITGMMRSFFERLLFPFLVYDTNYSTLAPKHMPTAFMYTMNISEDMVDTFGYKNMLQNMESVVGRIFSSPKLLYAYNTYQFDDYSKYKIEIFSEADKAAYRKNQFPIDCQQASQIGYTIVQDAAKSFL